MLTIPLSAPKISKSSSVIQNLELDLMSLLGIEVGTTGCKALVISVEGVPLGQAHRDYSPIIGPAGERELDSPQVWAAVRQVISEVAACSKRDPIRALSVASMGEAMTPLSIEGHILGNCLLGADQRGAQYLRPLEQRLGVQRLFDITGSVPGAPCSLPKLCWLRDNRRPLYDRTWRFVPWSSLVNHLLGGSSVCDYSLAGRTLLFDLYHERWSHEILEAADLPIAKLPELAPAGTPVGTVSAAAARELGLPADVRMILGGHDLCCNALGAGCVRHGMVTLYLGNALYLTVAFQAVALTSLLLGRGLNMEHHVVPGLFVTFSYNPSGGSALRWFADTLAPLEKRQAQKRGVSIYGELLSEMPEEPTRLMVLPHFAPTGPPYFDARSSGAILGLGLSTARGEIVKALLEGLLYVLAEGQELVGQVGLRVNLYRATGSIARPDQLLQLAADILGASVERPRIVEATALGAAILAGIGIRVYANPEEAVSAVVRVQQRFVPDDKRHALYRTRMERYRELYPLLRDYLHRLHDLPS